MPADQDCWVPPATVNPSELKLQDPPEDEDASLVPTMPTPGELLNKHYPEWASVRDWTDPKGPLRKQLEMYCKYPKYAVRPIGSAGLVGQWPRPGGLRAVPVPMYRENSPFDWSKVIVEFKNCDPKCPSKGIRIIDIFEGKVERIESPGNDVLDRVRERAVKFVIAWPGYRPEQFTIYTRGGAGPLTRFELAAQIAIAYGQFFVKVEKETLLPDKVGYFNIALHQGANSKHDSLGVQLSQVYLVKFRGTTDGCYAAEVEIV